MTGCRLNIGHLLAGLIALSACTVVQAQDRISIVNEGGIRDAWALAPGATLPVPAYPAAYAAEQAETCVAIGYLLNADGTTSDFALLKSWSAGEPRREREAFWSAFANDASGALARWRFVPRPEVTSPVPVYTVATFLFGAKNGAELRKRCAIPSLAFRIIELRQSAKTRRRMSGSEIFSRLHIDPAVEQRYNEQLRVNEQEGRDVEPELPPPGEVPTPR